MPTRNQLLDQNFPLFCDPPRWGRDNTQQPEAYLEVLYEVDFLHRSGEYNGL